MNQLREVKSIRVKRQHVQFSMKSDRDKYGHWWFEIGDPRTRDSESYGWWPEEPVDFHDTLLGIAGELNGQSSFGGLPRRDPHHGDHVEDSFHPMVLETDTRTDEEIADCIRRFAGQYKGEWRWILGWGQNCHTFQMAALKHCRLFEPVRLKKAMA